MVYIAKKQKFNISKSANKKMGKQGLRNGIY